MITVLLALVTTWTSVQPAASPLGSPAAVGNVAAQPAKALPADEVSSERLVEVIKSLPTKRAARGDLEHQEGLLKTEAVIVEQLKALGYEPTLEVVDAIGLGRDKSKPYHNIIVEIKGRGGPASASPSGAGTPPTSTAPQTGPASSPAGKPAVPAEKKPSTPTGGSPAAVPAAPVENAPGLLIVGAHIDAVPRAPGADDNGSGVACLMEMARLLKDRPMRHDVRLCFFNLEECGLVGSTIHASGVKDTIVTPKKQAIIGMISMDMLGFYSAEPNSQKSPIPEIGDWKPPEVADFIAMATVLKHRKFSQSLTKAMKETSPGLKVVTVDFLPIALPDLLRSDHAPFLAIGVPAVIVSDTAEFRSKHYHKPTDTIETLDIPRFTMTVKGLVGAVHRLAEPLDGPAAAPAEQAKP